ncbi:Chemotaxis response regulator protein-glutamate methylesterase [Gemmata sp. SH-PL17]|uniref:chemotaxis-specific protein-glutamate methyltransferase CheB n=1 Tax=Gemmata sp. SH-PL17 TaxID=1630693 RepID=UPI00078C442A|nr:chemotaxis-specific protein-glutamate methyltransferase CheB [Gemmata sp. SH-PL17]AMV24954.1 Chemotaxis response regulator protein-glutamate methylesterase [Gemmata sp. SH-PL17]
MNLPVRVLIVDDSRIYRAAIEEALAGQDGIVVCGSVWSGPKALDHIRAQPPDLVTLDVEMPGMNGLDALQAIQAFNATRPGQPEVGVVMVSAYTSRGAEATLQALQAGAFDFIEKPKEASHAQNVLSLRQQLTDKIRAFQQRHRRNGPQPVAVPPRPATSPRRAVRAVVVAVSTGGPRALSQLVAELSPQLDQPVFIVQHIPPEFTKPLAESLARQSGRRVVEAAQGDLVQPRTIYIAPGGQHMLLRTVREGVHIVLNRQPPENGFRPSANVLFRSAPLAYGGDVVAVVLTGMGSDGSEGIEPIKRAGGLILAQDEGSSVVWGMPGSAVATGHVDEVLPLHQIATRINSLCQKRSF